MYESADDVVARFPTAADYAEEANAWARAVRSAFPRATVAVVGSYSEHYGSDARRKSWNEEVYAKLDPSAANGLILHIYQGSGLGSCTPVHGLGEGSWGSAADQAKQYAALTTGGGVDKMLDVPRRVLRNITDAHTAPAQLRIVVTEFNMFDRCGPVRLTWAHGLYVAIMAQRLLAHERIELAAYHALGGNPMFTALYTFNSTLSGLLLNGVAAPPTPPYAPTAPGLVIASLNRASQGAVIAREQTFSALANVTGFVFTDGESPVGLWLVNSGTTAAEIAAPADVTDELVGSVMRADPTAWITDAATDMDIRPLTVRAGGKVSMPAYSVAWARARPSSQRLKIDDKPLTSSAVPPLTCSPNLAPGTSVFVAGAWSSTCECVQPVNATASCDTSQRANFVCEHFDNIIPFAQLGCNLHMKGCRLGEFGTQAKNWTVDCALHGNGEDSGYSKSTARCPGWPAQPGAARQPPQHAFLQLSNADLLLGTGVVPSKLPLASDNILPANETAACGGSFGGLWADHALETLREQSLLFFEAYKKANGSFTESNGAGWSASAKP